LKAILIAGAASAGVVGCASAPRAPAASAPVAFLQYLPGHDGGVRLTSPYGGILTQRGPCLGLLNGDLFTTIIWPETARLSFDARGLVLRDATSGTTARLGDWVEITGGPLPPGTEHDLSSPPLNEVMPIECARRPNTQRHGWIGIANSGFRSGHS
jgi:hypothetical protein